MNYDTYRGLLNEDLVEGITPSGKLELPTIFSTDAAPQALISFDKAIGHVSPGKWVHFFIHDRQFMRIWRNPWRYLPILARFEGVIAPDFSVFWNQPLYKQLEAVSHSREIGSWLQRNGLTVIPCVRWGKEPTFDFAFDGIEPGGTIAIGTTGCMRNKECRKVLEAGVGEMFRRITPRRVVVYGPTPKSVVSYAHEYEATLIPFQSSTALAHSKAVR